MTKNAGQFQNTQSGVLSNKIYYRLKGKQKQRAYPAVIANPRTSAQMAVRVSLANINNLFRILSQSFPIVFQGKDKRQTKNNCFTSINKNLVPVYLNKSEAALKYCVISNYIVSKGSLTPFPELANELTEVGQIHLWGPMLQPGNYTGNNTESLKNAMKNTFKDFDKKESIHIALLYGPVDNVSLRYIKIDFKSNSLPDGVFIRNDGFLYIEVSNINWLISGCVFMRKSLDYNGHVVVSSQSITPSNGFMPPEYKRATGPYQDAAILSYQ